MFLCSTSGVAGKHQVGKTKNSYLMVLLKIKNCILKSILPTGIKDL